MIMFSTTGAHSEGDAKDSLKNIEEIGEFVVNIVGYSIREAMNLSSADLPRDHNEFEFSGITPEPSALIKVPRVKESLIHLGCAYYSSVQLPTPSKDIINRMVIGKVLGTHVDPSIMTEGRIDMAKLQPIARLGYNDYVKVEQDIFEMTRPRV